MRQVAKRLVFVAATFLLGGAVPVAAQSTSVWVGSTVSRGVVFTRVCTPNCFNTVLRANGGIESFSAGVDFTLREADGARLRFGIGVSRRGWDVTQPSVQGLFATVPLVGEVLIPLVPNVLGVVLGIGVAAEIGMDHVNDSHLSVLGEWRLRAGSTRGRHLDLGLRLTRSVRPLPRDDDLYLRSLTLFIAAGLPQRERR